jgi:hypothetical protein
LFVIVCYCAAYSRGLNLGLLGMCVGDTRVIFIPPSLGSPGAKGLVTAKVTLDSLACAAPGSCSDGSPAAPPLGVCQRGYFTCPYKKDSGSAMPTNWWRTQYKYNGD